MVCEPCNSKLLGGFDPDKKEVQLYSKTFLLIKLDIPVLHRGYYMTVQRYEISL